MDRVEAIYKAIECDVDIINMSLNKHRIQRYYNKCQAAYSEGSYGSGKR
ncbi:MAG: hypothetical protein ACLR6T_09015 [Intestinibacter sp.]